MAQQQSFTTTMSLLAVALSIVGVVLSVVLDNPSITGKAPATMSADIPATIDPNAPPPPPEVVPAEPAQPTDEGVTEADAQDRQAEKEELATETSPSINMKDGEDGGEVVSSGTQNDRGAANIDRSQSSAAIPSGPPAMH